MLILQREGTHTCQMSAPSTVHWSKHLHVYAHESASLNINAVAWPQPASVHCPFSWEDNFLTFAFCRLRRCCLLQKKDLQPNAYKCWDPPEAGKTRQCEMIGGGRKKHKGRLRADGSKSKNSLLRYSEGGTLPGGGLDRTTAWPAEPKKATVHIKSSCLESYWSYSLQK